MYKPVLLTGNGCWLRLHFKSDCVLVGSKKIKTRLFIASCHKGSLDQSFSLLFFWRCKENLEYLNCCCSVVLNTMINFFMLWLLYFRQKGDWMGLFCLEQTLTDSCCFQFFSNNMVHLFTTIEWHLFPCMLCSVSWLELSAMFPHYQSVKSEARSVALSFTLNLFTHFSLPESVLLCFKKHIILKNACCLPPFISET